MPVRTLVSEQQKPNSTPKTGELANSSPERPVKEIVFQVASAGRGGLEDRRAPLENQGQQTLPVRNA